MFVVAGLLDAAAGWGAAQLLSSFTLLPRPALEVVLAPAEQPRVNGVIPAAKGELCALVNYSVQLDSRELSIYLLSVNWDIIK